MSDTAYTFTRQGMTLFHDGQSFNIGREHPNWDAIIEALQAERFDSVLDLINVKRTVAESIEGVEINEHGVVTFQGAPIHNVVTERILEFMQAGLPYEPLARFLANLMENPSSRSVDELYRFLEMHNEDSPRGMPITTDGCFIAYKGVKADWHDKWTGTVNNAVGQKPSMPRNQVDDDFRKTCSKGLHAGTFEYANGWAPSDGHVILVKINPRDCVSVPSEHGATKIRVCAYEVVAEAERLLDTPLYVGETDEAGDDFEMDTLDEIYGYDPAQDESLDMDEDPLYFDERMNRWRDRTQGGRVVSAEYAARYGYRR